MKWFFCWSQDTEFHKDHDWPDLIRVAVQSALQHTDLEPHFIYDGEPSDLTCELERAGVKIHYHRLSFTNVLAAYSSDTLYQSIARGAFLRFDIPLFAGSDDFVLYTDADVIFRERIDLKGYRPEFIAAAPQFERGGIRDMNSGVMVMNVAAWHARRPELLDFTARNIHLGLDQEVLREFIGLDYLLLPDRFNWKPYWGVNQDAAIIHWQGPKPAAAARWLADPGYVTHLGWMPLLELGRESYAWCLKQHETLLNGWRERMALMERAASQRGR